MKLVPVAAVLGIAATAGTFYGFGPYGMFRSKPPVCDAQQTCVIVAGIDGDVAFGPGAGGEAMGVDVDDEAATRLVYWLEHAAPAGVEVDAYKFPARVEMPESGVRSDPGIGRRALRRARDIGTRYHARLVLIGSVSGDSVSVAFINPHSTYEDLSIDQLGVYDISGVDWSERFRRDYEAALRSVWAGSTDPTTPSDPGNQDASLEAEDEVKPPPETTEVATSADPANADSGYTPIVQPPREPPRQPIVEPATYLWPDARYLEEAYPGRAYSRRVGGSVTLNCRVTVQRRLRDCRALGNDRDPWRFRPAAVELAEEYMQGAPQRIDGVPVDGGEVQFTIRFDRED